MPKLMSDDYWGQFKKDTAREVKKMIKESDGRDIGLPEQMMMQAFVDYRLDTESIGVGVRVPVRLLRELVMMQSWLATQPELGAVDRVNNSSLLRAAISRGVGSFKEQMKGEMKDNA